MPSVPSFASGWAGVNSFNQSFWGIYMCSWTIDSEPYRARKRAQNRIVSRGIQGKEQEGMQVHVWLVAGSLVLGGGWG